MIETRPTPVAKQPLRYSPDPPADPDIPGDSIDMIRASRLKIDRSLETLRRVARLLAKMSKN